MSWTPTGNCSCQKSLVTDRSSSVVFCECGSCGVGTADFIQTCLPTNPPLFFCVSCCLPPRCSCAILHVGFSLICRLISSPSPPPPYSFSVPSSHPYCSLSKPYSWALSWLCSTGVSASCGRKVHTDMTSVYLSVCVWLHLYICGRKDDRWKYRPDLWWIQSFLFHWELSEYSRKRYLYPRVGWRMRQTILYIFVVLK